MALIFGKIMVNEYSEVIKTVDLNQECDNIVKRYPNAVNLWAYDKSFMMIYIIYDHLRITQAQKRNSSIPTPYLNFICIKNYPLKYKKFKHKLCNNYKTLSTCQALCQAQRIQKGFLRFIFKYYVAIILPGGILSGEAL